MKLLKFLPITLAVLSFAFQFSTATPDSNALINNPLGVNYGQLADNLPPPEQVVKLLKSTLIGKIRIFDTDPVLLKAFANTGIGVVVGVNNDQVASLTDANTAHDWVAKNIAVYTPATKINLITVGNEVFTADDGQLYSLILPAMKNIHAALASFKLDNAIKVSTPHSFALLANSFPPSSGVFRQEVSGMYLKPLIQFLADTRAPFLINAYPFFAYRNNPKEIPLAYALFLPNPGAVDPKTGLIYTNLFTAQIDATYSAIEKLGYFGIPVTITETGWPSSGDVDEAGVNIQNARTYNQNLISHLASSSGTPLRPRQPIDVFVFALFNEDRKYGPASERNYGLFRTDGSAVYECGLMKAANVNSAVNTSNSYQRSAAAHTWCVSKLDVEASQLLKGLNYACGEGAADCQAIQQGGPCFYPNSVNSHASYAFNMYYQKYGRNVRSCDFRGSATVTTVDPSYGSCYYY